MVTTDSFTATDGWVYVDESASIDVEGPRADGSGLESVFPNPAGHGTLISYYLARPGHVTLAVYNSQGQRVKTLDDGYRSAGGHHTEWDGTNELGQPVASGTYFCALETELANHVRKVVLMR